MDRLEFMVDGTGMTAEARDSVLSMLAEHGSVKVTVQAPRPSRSQAQNSMFMLCTRRLARQSGMSVEGMKAAVKDLAVDYGYPVLRDGSGDPVTDGEGNLVPLPSHLADVVQFGILIDTCMHVAAEFGLDLGDR